MISRRPRSPLYRKPSRRSSWKKIPLPLSPPRQPSGQTESFPTLSSSNPSLGRSGKLSHIGHRGNRHITTTLTSHFIGGCSHFRGKAKKGRARRYFRRYVGLSPCRAGLPSSFFPSSRNSAAAQAFTRLGIHRELRPRRHLFLLGQAAHPPGIIGGSFNSDRGNSGLLHSTGS